VVAPFNLTWGQSIYVQVIAINVYGQSLPSVVGSGAIIITSPDSPINLLETITLRTSTSITFSWTQGVSTGGSSIISYRVSYDQAIGVWINLASNIT